MNEIIGPTDFIFNDVMFYHDFTGNGRYYQLVSPRPGSAIDKKGLMARKRISQAYYDECFTACRQKTKGANYE
jgi:uncharacterized protein YcgI (DUF1989 family)